MSIVIESFGIESYESVVALWQECEGVGLSDADSRVRIERYLERNPGMSFIAHENGRIVGAILSGHDGRRGYIHHLAVDPAWRRKGLGQLLVDHAISAMAGAGVMKVHLFIFADNVDGAAFWESGGWVTREDLRVMSKQIDNKQSK